MSENLVVQSKISRHSAISRLLAENVVRSQGALQILLENAGFSVTQATLSRDLEELAATKVRDEKGELRYVLGGVRTAADLPLQLPGTLERWCAPLLIQATQAMNQVVLRTPPATAGTLASVVDKENLEHVLGCLAGDNTILVVCDSVESAKELRDKLRGLAKR